MTGVTRNDLQEAVEDRTGLALLEKQTTKNATRWEVNPKNSNLPLSTNASTSIPPTRSFRKQHELSLHCNLSERSA